MSSRIIRGLSASDLHIGANNVPAEKIISTLDNLITNDEQFAWADLVIYAGDVADKLLTQPSKEARLMRNWIDRNIDLSAKHDTTLAIVEGTPLHDWYQSDYFEESNRKQGNKSDLHYVKDVRIVRIEKLGIDVLFVPDEAHETCELTKFAVQEALIEAGLEKVDIVILHGQFPHNYPEHLRDKGLNFHDTLFYLSITRHFVFAGHIHTHSIYRRIVTHGSIERIGHGYEDPKGCVGFELNLDDPSKSKVWFIENKTAMIFKTIKVTTDDIQRESDIIRNIVSRFPPGSNIRIKAKAENPILNLVKEFKKEFPYFNWVGEKEKVKKTVEKKEISLKVRRVGVSIRPDNITDLIVPRLENYSEDDKSEILRVLGELK